MQAKTKQRLIGGIVLLAVVAIFLPLLFHNSRPSMNLQLSTETPQAPAKPEVQLQLPPIAGQHNDATDDSPIDVAGDAQSPSIKTVAQQTPDVTQKILNTKPAPATTPAPQTQLAEVQNVATAVLDSAATAEPSASNGLAQAPADSQTPATQTSLSTQPVSSTPRSTHVALSATVPQAWALQIASYAKGGDYANRLVKQLRAKGFEVFTRDGQANARAVTRVYVGPDINLDRLKRLQQQLKQQLHLTGVIKKYPI